MFVLKIHKQVQKTLKKSPQKIKQRAFRFLHHIHQNGLKDTPFPIDTLKRKYKKSHYYEVKIDKDYRIIFRQEGDVFYIHYAGTHNALGTG